MHIEKTSFRWVAGALLAVSLIAFTFSQQDKIREQAEQLLQFENKITSLEALLETETAANQALRTETETLKIENAALRDSIQLLEKQVGSLQHKLRQHIATLKGIQSELAKKEVELQRLRSQLADALAKGKSAEDRAEKLQADIQAVEQQKTSLVEMKKEEEKEETDAEQDLLKTEMEMQRTQKIEAVINNTQVAWKTIECSKTRSGNNIKKLEDDGSNWIYTSVQFDMDNENQQLLAEEYFVMRIINTDTGEELPYLESNPAFANSAGETKGFAFQWNGNPTKVVYINMQAKTGENYDLKIYFLSDEKEYLLKNSVKPLLRSGKVVG